ncbi:uro-adherence factor A-like isoform X2 [Argopecten irradians]|uniref:uro-adherence factor A-like isoform X2 n=1 Tax=Argopecten irradians TaxID=31199 RepID=UPI003714DE9E
MESKKKSATLPAGMAPPSSSSSGTHVKTQQKLSSHSFSGGFLSRLKRRFRLKSKGYELQPGSQTLVHGVRFQPCPDDQTGQRLQDEGQAGRRPGATEVLRTHSDRRTDRPPQYRGGHKKDERKARSDFLHDPNSAVKRNCLGEDLNIPNKYVASDQNVIDLEHDGECVDGDVFDDTDPGYETLDEIRRKMQIQFNQPQKMNGSACQAETDSASQRPKGPQHRRSQSTGHPQISHQSEFGTMLDSGLGSPMVSDTCSSMRTSDIATCKSLSVVSDTDISAYQSVSPIGYAHTDNFLNPSNLSSMRMNSCPGKTYDLIPGNSQDLLCQGGPEMMYNSDTYLPDHEVSELYANPKILLRKKTQREENEAKQRLSGQGSNRTSSNDSDEGNTSFDTDGKRSSTSDSKMENIEQDEESVPPIPERKYSLYLNQQAKRQNSLDKKVVTNNMNPSALDSHLEESTCAIPENSIFSDHKCLTDSAITDSVSSRILNQSADTFGQDSGFWLSEEEDLLRSCDTSLHVDRTDSLSRMSPASRFEKDERVILTGDVRTIVSTKPENESVVSDSREKGQATGYHNEHGHVGVNNDLYQSPWDVLNDSCGQRTNLACAISRQSGDIDLASDNVQMEFLSFDEGSCQMEDKHVQKRSSTGSRISYKEMTVCQSASSLETHTSETKDNTMALSNMASSVQSGCSVESSENYWSQKRNSQYRNSIEKQRNSAHEHRKSVEEHRDSVEEYRKCTEEHRNSEHEQRHRDSVQEYRNSTREHRNSKNGQRHRDSVEEYRNSIGELRNSEHEQRHRDSVQEYGQRHRDSVEEYRNRTGEHRNSEHEQTYRHSYEEYRNSKHEHRKSGEVYRNSGENFYNESVEMDIENMDIKNKKQSKFCNSLPNNESIMTDNASEKFSNGQSSYIPNKRSEFPELLNPPCPRLSQEVENNSNSLSPAEKDFESSLGGSTEPSLDSLGGSTDGLSEKSGEPHVVSYEDDADAVLESMAVQSESFADDMTMSLMGGAQSHSNDQILEGVQSIDISKDYDQPSDISETITCKTDSAEQETESISDPLSDDRVSSASTMSPSARLPDYYYQDNEPVHMSLSELGMSDEQWVDSEPIHMSVNELKRSKSHYEGERERRSHFNTPSPSFWQSPPQNDTTQSPCTNSTPNRTTLPPTHSGNVYETVDDEDDDRDLDAISRVRPNVHPVMQSAYVSNHGARPRRPYSAEVSSLHTRRDDEFMRRLDSRPPAIIPRTNPEEASQRDFMESMRQLKDCGWYWGPLSWDEAEIKLMNKPDGSFLVRDSSDDRYILSLSFNMQGRVHHTRIEHHKGKFSFWSQPDSHGKATIREFIEQCVKNSRNGQFLYFIRPSGPGSPPMPVHLLHPVSRYKQMQSLQHMCRFQILQKVRRDHIDKLPIPTQIKDYLKDPQYYVEYLEED